MSLLKKITSFIHREGWKFACISLVTSLVLLLISLPLAIIGFVLTFFIIWFFRDPDRKTPNIQNR